MKATIVDRKWVVEWFDERQCYHMPSLTLAPNGNLLAVWNGGFPVCLQPEKIILATQKKMMS